MIDFSCWTTAISEFYKLAPECIAGVTDITGSLPILYASGHALF